MCVVLLLLMVRLLDVPWPAACIAPFSLAGAAGYSRLYKSSGSERSDELFMYLTRNSAPMSRKQDYRKRKQYTLSAVVPHLV